MNKKLLILTMILSSLYSNAQSFSLEFDHYTILVKDIEKSRVFYKNILQLKEKKTPWGDDLPRPVIFF